MVDPGEGGGLSLWWGAAKKRGGSSTWTQGLDASLPPKGWDTIAGPGRFGTESCCERGIREREDWRWDHHVNFLLHLKASPYPF